MGSPTALTKAGWNRNKLKTGEMVTLTGWRAKNGTNFANAEEMTTPDGQTLSAASSYDRAVPTSGRTTPKTTDKTPNEKSTTGKSSTTPKPY